MKKKNLKPEQLSQIELKRSALNCSIGKSCLNMEPDHSPPDGVSPVEYALYCLLSAVEDIVTFLERRMPE